MKSYTQLAPIVVPRIYPFSSNIAYGSKSPPKPPVIASPITQGKMMCLYSGAPEIVHTTLDRPRDMNSLTWASRTTAGNFNTKSKSNRENFQMIHISPLDIWTNQDTENPSNSTNGNPMSNIVQSN